MKWYLHNLQSGFKTAFFFPSPQRFIASWHALVAIVATLILSQALIEVLAADKISELAYSWYEYQLCLFSLALAAAYLIGCIVRKGELVLDIAVGFLNTYYFIFLPYAAVKIVVPDLFSGGAAGPFGDQMLPLWAFLVMFRIVATSIESAGFFRLVAAGLLAAGMLYTLNSKVYFNQMFYTHDTSETEKPSPLDKLTGEEVFGMQPELLKKALEGIKASKPGQTDVYALTLGAYAYQDVFLRDVKFANKRLKSKLGVTNLVSMINNKLTVQETPLANTTNLKAALKELSAHYMQPKEDIALIFLTSHGSAKNGLSTNLGYGFSLMDISPQKLADALKESGIRNKVIIISACHSGVFIPALQDDHTMIITAAAKDKESFGCSDRNNLTYFTEAYFMNALSQTTDLDKAFGIAKAVVEKREKVGGIQKHSEPQIFVGSKIKDALRKYKGAKLVTEQEK